MNKKRQAVENSASTILEWDSKFFEFGVARLSPRSFKEAELDSVLCSLKDQNVRLVYWASPAEDADSLAAAGALKGRMVGCQILYDQLASTLDDLDSLVEYSYPEPNSELIDLAIQCSRRSRYSNDPGISTVKCEELYKIWISESTQKRLADHVLTYIRDDRIIGMMCVKKYGDENKLVIQAVDEAHRQTGVATKLVRGAITVGNRSKCSIHTGVVYEDNRGVCRLLENCGFSEKNRANFYHFWL